MTRNKLMLLFDLTFVTILILVYYYLGAKNQIEMPKYIKDDITIAISDKKNDEGLIPFEVKSEQKIHNYEVLCKTNKDDIVKVIVDSKNDEKKITGTLKFETTSTEYMEVEYECVININSK